MKKIISLCSSLLIFSCVNNDTNAQSVKLKQTDTTVSQTDLTKLPIGDGKISSKPTIGSVWSCQQNFNSNGPGAFKSGTWINQDNTTFNFNSKPTVDKDTEFKLPNNFLITNENDKRVITSNDIPNHSVGKYPVSQNDDAYNYDRNPNSIKLQNFKLELPVTPVLSEQSSCLPMGPIGFLLTGAVFFNPLDARGQDAVAHEIQDDCQGHPEKDGSYHYHSVTTCIDDNKSTGHSELVGYALDGFGIYGAKGENGKLLSNKDLDECHGHKHLINWDNKQVEMYHYHATREYPYTLGCFKGTPKTLNNL